MCSQPNIDYHHYNRIFGTDYYFVELESEEIVVAKIHADSIQDIGDRRDVLPIGQVVNDPVPDDILKINRESEYYSKYDSATDASFYIDMQGTHKEKSVWQPPNKESIAEGAGTIAMFVSFPLIRMVAVKTGLFPPIFPRRKK